MRLSLILSRNESSGPPPENMRELMIAEQDIRAENGRAVLYERKIHAMRCDDGSVRLLGVCEKHFPLHRLSKAMPDHYAAKKKQSEAA